MYLLIPLASTRLAFFFTFIYISFFLSTCWIPSLLSLSSMSSKSWTATTFNFQRSRALETSRFALFSTIKKVPSTHMQSTTTPRLTGVFVHEWPTVYASSAHFKRAWKVTKEVKIDTTAKNIRTIQRKYSAQWIDALMKVVDSSQA
jgi:hypothetical protein